MKLVLVAAALSAVSYAQIDMAKITDCSALFDECRGGPDANQAICAAAKAQCEQCQTDYNQCRAPGNGVSGNQAGCAAQVASCVGSAFPSLSSSLSGASTDDSDDCQATYKSCVAGGKNEELCGCDLATCAGEDNARTRDYCATVSASAAAPSSTATSTGSSDKCQSSYKACIAGGKGEELCGCDLATCAGEDNARTRDYCAAVSASASGSAPASTATAAAADSDDCQATWRQCVAGGRSEELCSCGLAVCTGEDSARNRAYCASLSAGLATATGAGASGATGLATSGVARPTSAVGGAGSNSTSTTPIVTGAAASVGVSVLGAASAFVSYLLM
ncbi:hypothetical protein INS49_012160 [Diaporthe citri]|uniref:uncharacterized protein n=1 Tax=Diaporthe citri TaxID=83186 RepID=UPI001C7EAB5E|nr:uncharacterized protein INS49_012160 [Diaporthe citri]KAG6358642.1 hypothetical protein INS49_012160 [Diaporthe citri]